ncbi:hypothetical protein Tco_1349561 [Tanacetum coccineum]
MPTTRQLMSFDAIKELIAQRMADALATYETNQNTENGNGNGNGNGSGSQSDGGSGSRRTMHTARGCTYKEFLNCQPLNFTNTEGAELALLCPRMVPEEEDKVEMYIWSLPDSIQGNVTLARTTRLQDTVKKSMLEPYLCATNANITILDRALQSAEIARGEQGRYKSNCSKLKNHNRENQTGNDEAWGRVYALGGGEANQDPYNIANNADV